MDEGSGPDGTLDRDALLGALASMPVLGSWTDAERSQLAAQLTGRSARKGELVVTQGQRDRSMYFCLGGSAVVLQNGVHLQRLRQSEHFGELALLNGTPRAAS
ncbi:MAG TPA: cyclic nucleotide-binding domain-containing protein [Polyangiales bacterium]